MEYISTRGNYQPVNSAAAISLGMVPEGGLFVPEKIPTFSLADLIAKKNYSYQDLAKWIFTEFLTDFKQEEITESVEKAYAKSNFPQVEKAPLVQLDQHTYILELWHGPTAAFKDFALQVLPYLLVKAVQKNNIKNEIIILVATSGDTGKAALEGFKDVPGVQIVVFYPAAGVSKVQEDQMLTTGGSNTSVVAIPGNFDDCQNTVKEIFADKKFRKKLSNNNYQFSSANSINWGRLLPQIVYYFKAYFNLLNNGDLTASEKINITVPTGNFGNILAAYYAYRMGLPVNKFICASNDNKVLTDFLKTGVYDIKREFKKTISPSMDILISSNLERFLYEITEHDSQKINSWYTQLKEEKSFKVDQKTLEKIRELFVGEYSTETEVKQAIKSYYEKYDYLLDPHTAVAVDSLAKYRNQLGDDTIAIVDSTANPYKFSRAVLESITGSEIPSDEYKVIAKLKELTALKIHPGLIGLNGLAVKHYHKWQQNQVKNKLIELFKLT
ncbi:threonine synthase [Halanaerobium salsuginis]|jgi:threonine synthase|uniref:Threonine synthase n=1 Tax=Halanaerobium salsuginis TaxID=29563 RepID=A0A1I4N2A4_9FIRM|nr:threonine synthase [Halanaerobium salsuginis]SFM09649.1 L-threonine synthase [Halanaerobium salsuginis]